MRLDDCEQVEGSSVRQAVDTRDRHHAAGGEVVQHPVQLAPVAGVSDTARRRVSFGHIFRNAQPVEAIEVSGISESLDFRTRLFS
jgi:hypothetical protein